MGIKKLEIEGQLALDMCLDTRNNVVQSNAFVRGRQPKLKIASMKLLRLAIMQISPNDSDFKPYVVSVKDLAKLIGMNPDNLYREAKAVKNDILENHVDVYDDVEEEFKGYSWALVCEYKKKVGFAIVLNPLLKPFLVGLRDNYTLYPFLDVKQLTSTYGIRIYELIMSYIIGDIPKNGCHVRINLDDLRLACDCEDKLVQIGQFKEKVVDKAIADINEHGSLEISYTDIKKGNTIVAFDFFVKPLV